MVDWKKDVKLGGGKKKPEAEGKAEPASLLKKEIHLFGGKKKAAPVQAEAAAPVESEEKTPWYKKEVGRKRPPAAAEPAGDSSTPWYKKEVGRKKPAAAAAKAPSTPWYKKEIGRKKPEPFVERRVSPPLPLGPALERRKPPVIEPEPVVDREPTPVSYLPEREPEPEPAPVAYLSERVSLPPVQDDEEQIAEREPLVALPVPEPDFVPEPEPEPEPELEPELEPAAGEPLSWVDAVRGDAEPVATPAPSVPEPVAETPVPTPEPVAIEPVPVPEPPAFVPAEPVAAEPAPAEPRVPHEDPRAVHAPVRAHELPPLDEELDARPWYKKELSFKRSPAAAEPAGEKKPFWKKELGRPKVEQAAEVDATAKSTPFWKKQIGGGTKEPKPPKPQRAEAEPTTAKGESKPFWKKELSFGKGAKQPKAKRGADAAAPATAAAGTPNKVMTRESRWKSGLSMPSFSLPSLPGRGGGGGGSRAVPKQLVGLKIGASQLAAARVMNNGHAEVMQVAREDLEAGIVVGGELRDPDALADALKVFFARNKLPKKGVRLGIANNRIGVRTFDITGIHDPKQLANAIRFRAQEALPIPIEDAVLDYQVLSETLNEEGETVRKILLVVAYRELVDRYLAACKKAGIQLVGIDLEAFALLRSLAAPPEADAKNAAALVAVAVGHDRSTFAVSDGRVCEFTRVLEWGGQNVSVAIARTLDMAPSEAEPIKRLLSLEGGPAPEGLTDQQFTAVREAVSRQVSAFARELVSSLQFYQSQPGSLGIGEIVLTGGTAHLQGFAAELQRVIGVKVRVGDPLVRVKVSKRMREPEQLGSLAVAIGLGIED
jgi:type IV pilus assembly protein PilM